MDCVFVMMLKLIKSRMEAYNKIFRLLTVYGSFCTG